ncbi:MAG: hypothetical protein ACR2IE_01515 [Candidatus Sumerlaeaceae bacterium]
MRVNTWLLAATLLLLAIHWEAAACGVCVYSLADPYVPIGPITGVSVLWYVVSVIVVRAYGIPYVGMTLLFAAASVLGGVLVSMMLGPISLVPLGILAAVLWARSLRKRARQTSLPQKRGYQVLRWTGVAMLVALVSWGTWDRWVRRDWRTADWLNQWEGTQLGSSLLRKLESQGATSVAEARDVVERTADVDSPNAAKILATYGDAATDVPRMLALRRRLEKKQMAWAMHEPLSKATGLTLDREATAEQWELAWKQKRDEQTSSTLP